MGSQDWPYISKHMLLPLPHVAAERMRRYHWHAGFVKFEDDGSVGAFTVYCCIIEGGFLLCAS